MLVAAGPHRDQQRQYVWHKEHMGEMSSKENAGGGWAAQRPEMALKGDLRIYGSMSLGRLGRQGEARWQQ